MKRQLVCSKSKDGLEDVEDNRKCGHSSTLITNENVGKEKEMVLAITI